MLENGVRTETARDRLLCAVQEANTPLAMQSTRAILEANSNVRNWAFIAQMLKRAPKKQLALKPYKVALLSSFSTEFFHAPLVAYGLANGFDIEIYQSGLSQFRQEILNPASGLFRFEPDVTIFAVEGADWLHELYREYGTHVDAGLDATISNVQREMHDLVEAFRHHSDSSLLIHNFNPPVRPQFGIIDARIGNGQIASVQAVNQWLGEECRRIPNLYVLDYAALVARHGALRWYDERMSNVAKAPIAMDMLPHLMSEYMKFFRALTGRSKKCLVLDLDNTLWGGTLGENGVDGIQLGPTYPGSAFLEFQQSILNLQKRGVLLAVASKNNAADVDEVFDNHPHMLLRREHFVCAEIHWRSKVESIMEIARQTNIGLDHIVFVDDSAVECAEVSQIIPEVHVIQLPDRPELFTDAVTRDGLFDAINYSAEDSRRTELYRQRYQAEMARGQAASLEDFYRSLQMRVTFASLQAPQMQRAAQITQKTNQFNATTRRYTEGALEGLLEDPKWLAITVGVKDRFGDNGVVGLMLGREEAGALDIDTFLLSCRVIGRTIETAMLAHLCRLGRQRGLQEIAGCVIPTPKNAPVRDVFERHGFRKVDAGPDGATRWRLSIAAESLSYPAWIEVES